MELGLVFDGPHFLAQSFGHMAETDFEGLDHGIAQRLEAAFAFAFLAEFLGTFYGGD